MTSAQCAAFALWAACVIEAYSLFGAAGAFVAVGLAIGGMVLIYRRFNRKGVNQ